MPEPEPECLDSATYAVTFRAVWNASSHGNQPPFPSGAHFSRVVGAAHAPEVSFWSSGGIATPGIENMAETGSVSSLCREIDAEADRGGSTTCVRGSESSFPSPGSARLLVEATEELPLMTLVSMIAPSPDWFVGVSGMPLMEDGCWKERIEVELVGYDAGTDSGATFTARDADVTPHEPIGLIQELPASVREEPFAVLVLTLSEEPE
ncbi:MAG: spondin domain-containing protein [Acidobacteriota bacterium]|nr:spondin domain-containing protein [Acidobacteriota bacterium]